jgi:hypothetical protein
LTDYQASELPRKLDDGYINFPNLSVVDAFNAYSKKDMGKQILDKLHPYIKTPYELATNKDLFMGGELRPSTTTDPYGSRYYKPLGSKGYKYKALQDMGLPFMQNTGDNDVVDDSTTGSPQTQSDALVVIDKLLSTMLPNTMGLDVPATLWGRSKYEDQGAIRPSLYTPTNMFDVSEAQKQYQKQKKGMKKFIRED